MAYFGKLIYMTVYRTTDYNYSSSRLVDFVNTTIIDVTEANNTLITLVDTQTWSETIEVRESLEYVDREFDTTIHQPGKNGFAVGVAPYYGIDTNYYSPVIYQVSRTNYGAATSSSKTYKWCNSTLFPYNWTAAYNKYADWYYCYPSTTWNLQGTLTSASYQYVYFDLKRCSGKSTCKNDSDMQYQMDGGGMIYIWTESYYDYTASVSSPVARTMSPIYEYVLFDFYSRQLVTMEIQENIITFVNGSTSTFYSLADFHWTNSHESTTNSASYKQRLTIVLSPKRMRYVQYKVTQPTNVNRRSKQNHSLK